jgi:hypothetical protein
MPDASVAFFEVKMLTNAEEVSALSATMFHPFSPLAPVTQQQRLWVLLVPSP